MAVESKVAPRGEIVEIGLLLQQGRRLISGLLEFRVLQLQLDLTHLQFVQEFQRLFNYS